jgi:hypothetical protein
MSHRKALQMMMIFMIALTIMAFANIHVRNAKCLIEVGSVCISPYPGPTFPDNRGIPI